MSFPPVVIAGSYVLGGKSRLNLFELMMKCLKISFDKILVSVKSLRVPYTLRFVSLD